MINAVLFAIAITQIIGGISVIIFNHNISVRGMYWGLDSFEGNVIQIIFGIFIIIYIFYSEYKRKNI